MLRQCTLRSREYSSLGWSSVSTGSSWNVKTTGRPGVHGHQLKLLCCLKHMRQQVCQSSSCHWPIETEFSAISRCLYVNRISHPWGFGAEPRHPLWTTSLLFHNGFCLITGPQWRWKLNRALPSYQVSWAVHHTVRFAALPSHQVRHVWQCHQWEGCGRYGAWVGKKKTGCMWK